MKLKKIISVATAICFLVTFAGQNLSWAKTPAQQNSVADEFKKIFETIPKIPAEYGKVTNVSDFGSKTIVVNIQDLHCHPEAQRGIAKIIDILDKNYKVKNIFVEGAYDNIDISWLTNISEKEMRESITDNLLEEGRLSASEYYAVKNGKTGMLLGLENEQRHKENIKRLGFILERQEVYSAVLAEIKSNIDYFSAQYTNDRNKRFNRILDRYKEGKISEEKFYALLQKYISKINAEPGKYNNVLPIKLSEYPNIQNYVQFMKLSSKINMKQVYSQLQSLLALLKEKLPKEGFQLFLDKTENLTNIDMLSISLTNFCEAFDLNLDVNYKQLNMFFKNQAVSRSVNPLDMIQEERHLIERLRASFSYDQTEYEIAFLNDFYGYFSDYLQNKLMADDFIYFTARFGQFRELYAKYAVVNDINSISGDFDLLNAYYNLNDHRNEIFVNNIFKYSQPDRSAAKTLQKRKADDCFKDAEEIIIVVTGGYHSIGLKELLNAKGITNIIVTPTVTTELEGAERIYEKIVLEQSIFLRQALAFTIASQATAQEQYNLITAAGLSYLNDAMSSRSFDFERSVKVLESIYKDTFGKDAVSNVRKEENDYIITFKTASFITLQFENGKLSLKESAFNEEKKLKPLHIKDLFRAAGTYAANSVKIPITDSYELIKGLFTFAEQNNISNFTFSDGLTKDVDDHVKTHKLTKLDGVNITTVAKMPNAMQEAMMAKDKAAEKKEQEPEANADTVKTKEKVSEGAKIKNIVLGKLAAVMQKPMASSVSDRVPGAAAEQQTPAAQMQSVSENSVNLSNSDELQALLRPKMEELAASRIADETDIFAYFSGGSKQTDRSELPAYPAINSEKNINDSLAESETKENLDIVTEAYMKLQARGITFMEKYPVLFLQNVPENRQTSAAAETNRKFIVIPSSVIDNVDESVTRAMKVDEIAARIAIGATHIENANNPAKLEAVIGKLLSAGFKIKASDFNFFIDEAAAETLIAAFGEESGGRTEENALSERLSQTLKEEDILQAAISSENIEMVNKMAQEGKGAFAIASAVSFKEFFKSVLHPVEFYRSHESKAGAAALLAITYLSAIATAGLALFIPAVSLAAMPLAIVIGAFSNITAHIIIDYHFIKASGLIDAVKEFGSAAKLNEKGYITMPVYVLNDEPSDYSSLNFANSGVKIKGNTLWIGEAENAIVLFAKDTAYADIAQEMSSNRKLNDKIRKISSKDIKIALGRDNIAVDWIEVNHDDNSDYIGYSANGNIQASYSMYKKMLDIGEIQEFSASLRTVKNIDASVFAQGILHNLDDITNMQDFIEYLDQHQKIGNGQIVINYEVLNDIITDINNIKGSAKAVALMEFLLDARKSGVQVFVNAQGAQNQRKLENELDKLGFAGYVSVNAKTGKTELFNYSLRSASEVNSISDFNNAADLENEIKRSSGSVMISNKALRNIINSERSGMIIHQIVEILSSAKILKLFTPADITPEFAMKAARNFDITEIPDLGKIASSQADIKTLVQKAAQGQLSAMELKTIISESGTAQSNAVIVYLAKLESQIKGKTAEEAAEILNAFAAGFVERMLAADKLRKMYKAYGLKDKNYEIILGQALFRQILHATADKGVYISPDNLGKTMKEAEERLAEELNGLLPKAFDNNDAVAINTLIELIPPIAQEELRLEAKDIKPALNMKNIEKIMAAA